MPWPSKFIGEFLNAYLKVFRRLVTLGVCMLLDTGLAAVQRRWSPLQSVFLVPASRHTGQYVVGVTRPAIHQG